MWHVTRLRSISKKVGVGKLNVLEPQYLVRTMTNGSSPMVLTLGMVDLHS